MAEPLFSREEDEALAAAIDTLEQQYRGNAYTFAAYWSQRQALYDARRVEMVRRAQARAEEYLAALTILVGSRGGTFIPFEGAFAQADRDDVRGAFARFDTPEARRALAAILRALAEVPRSWARSAFVRFLRGIGKQARATYDGAGMFGVRYGWAEREVVAICAVLCDADSPYANVLMSYADVAKEIREDDPDYQVVDHKVDFAATRVARDVAFLGKLCAMLEDHGLGPVPSPADEEPKRVRQPKVFRAGAVIRRRDLRDLPLPAHVRIPIMRRRRAGDPWVASTIEQVVTKLHDDGTYTGLVVHPERKTAHHDPLMAWRRKEALEGATFLGEWTGEINTQEIRLGFAYRFGADP